MPAEPESDPIGIALRVARALTAVGADYFLGGSLASSLQGEPRSTNDIDFVKAWVTLMIHGAFELPTRRYAVGTAYLRGQGAGRVHHVEGLDVVERELGHLICDVRLPERGQTPTGSYEGEGFIILRHPETEVVAHALRRVVSTVRVHLA